MDSRSLYYVVCEFQRDPTSKWIDLKNSRWLLSFVEVIIFFIWRSWSWSDIYSETFAFQLVGFLVTKRAEAFTNHISLICPVLTKTHFITTYTWSDSIWWSIICSKKSWKFLTYFVDFFFLKNEYRRHVFIRLIEEWFCAMTCISKYHIVHFIQLMISAHEW